MADGRKKMQGKENGKTQIFLDKKQTADEKAKFNLFDTNTDGKISSKEFGTAVKGLGIEATDAEIKGKLGEADADGNGTVDFKEFLGNRNMVGKKEAKKITQQPVVGINTGVVAPIVDGVPNPFAAPVVVAPNNAANQARVNAELKLLHKK